MTVTFKVEAQVAGSDRGQLTLVPGHEDDQRERTTHDTLKLTISGGEDQGRALPSRSVTVPRIYFDQALARLDALTQAGRAAS